MDYAKVQKHEQALQSIAALGNSGTGIFDLAKKAVIFYSNNFGNLLGYQQSDYKEIGQQFFAEKIHLDDVLTCSMNGVSILKLMSKFNSDEKLNHKLVSEYRMLNAEGKYVRLIEQYQVLELDEQGQIWLMMNIVDILRKKPHKTFEVRSRTNTRKFPYPTVPSAYPPSTNTRVAIPSGISYSMTYPRGITTY